MDSRDPALFIPGVGFGPVRLGETNVAEVLEIYGLDCNVEARRRGWRRYLFGTGNYFLPVSTFELENEEWAARRLHYASIPIVENGGEIEGPAMCFSMAPTGVIVGVSGELPGHKISEEIAVERSTDGIGDRYGAPTEGEVQHPFWEWHYRSSGVAFLIDTRSKTIEGIRVFLPYQDPEPSLWWGESYEQQYLPQLTTRARLLDRRGGPVAAGRRFLERAFKIFS